METFLLAVTIAAAIIGIIAGVVQVLDYVQRRRAENTAVPVTKPATSLLTINDEAPPHNLPPHGEFVGREEEKGRVLEALASRWPLTCIDGIGGIGKTSLALEVAYTCLGDRTNTSDQGIPTCEGIVWVSAKDRAITLDDLLDTTARTLGYPGVTQQPLDEKRESIRKILQEKPFLLIVVPHFTQVLGEEVVTGDDEI